MQVRLHGARGAEAIERLDHEVAVAQPAIAVVPVARAVRRLGDGGRQRGQHRAGVLVGAQLQRDRRADHGVLPVRRHRERAHPFLPVAECRAEELAHQRGGRFLQRLVRPDDEMQRPLQHDRPVLEQRRQRRVGGDAVIQSVGAETDVVAAVDPRLTAFAVTRGRAQSQAQCRPAGERLDGAHEHHGAEYAATRTKAWRKIQDTHHSAVRVVQAGLEDRRVAQVVLFGARQVQHVDGEHALSPHPRLLSAAARKTPDLHRVAADRPTPAAPVRRSARPPGNCRSRRSSRRHRQLIESRQLLEPATHRGRPRQPPLGPDPRARRQLPCRPRGAPPRNHRSRCDRRR